MSEPQGEWQLCGRMRWGSRGRTEPVGPPGHWGQQEAARTCAAPRKPCFMLEARGSPESILNRKMRSCGWSCVGEQSLGSNVEDGSERTDRIPETCRKTSDNEAVRCLRSLCLQSVAHGRSFSPQRREVARAFQLLSTTSKCLR